MYDVSHGIKDQADIDVLNDFFMARLGSASGFRYKDWADYTAVGEAIGTGDSIEVDFQLVKAYTSGSDTVSRNIKTPVSGTVTIYLAGVPQTETTHYTIDYTTGIVTFVSAPGAVAITADFEFDVPVRFGSDDMQVMIVSFDNFEWGSISLVELR